MAKSPGSVRLLGSGSPTHAMRGEAKNLRARCRWWIGDGSDGASETAHLEYSGGRDFNLCPSAHTLEAGALRFSGDLSMRSPRRSEYRCGTYLCFAEIFWWRDRVVAARFATSWPFAGTSGLGFVRQCCAYEICAWLAARRAAGNGFF